MHCSGIQQADMKLGVERMRKENKHSLHRSEGQQEQHTHIPYEAEHPRHEVVPRLSASHGKESTPQGTSTGSCTLSDGEQMQQQGKERKNPRVFSN